MKELNKCKFYSLTYFRIYIVLSLCLGIFNFATNLHIQLLFSSGVIPFYFIPFSGSYFSHPSILFFGFQFKLHYIESVRSGIEWTNRQHWLPWCSVVVVMFRGGLGLLKSVCANIWQYSICLTACVLLFLIWIHSWRVNWETVCCCVYLCCPLMSQCVFGWCVCVPYCHWLLCCHLHY